MFKASLLHNEILSHREANKFHAYTVIRKLKEVANVGSVYSLKVKLMAKG